MAKADHTDSTHTTTTTTNTSGGSTGMAFVIGALVVAVGVMAYVMLGGSSPADSGDVSITVEGAGAAVEGAAEAVEGAATGESN